MKVTRDITKETEKLYEIDELGGGGTKLYIIDREKGKAWKTKLSSQAMHGMIGFWHITMDSDGGYARLEEYGMILEIATVPIRLAK